ncbi:hypothetical protein AVEN_198954-1, partial [Araneus ventricosus]
HKEQLLPYSYQTNCVNYNITWMKNNRTGPRSQEACKEMWRSIFLKDCFVCDPGRIMIDNPEDLCTPGSGLAKKNVAGRTTSVSPAPLSRCYTNVKRIVPACRNDMKGTPIPLKTGNPCMSRTRWCSVKVWGGGASSMDVLVF